MAKPVPAAEDVEKHEVFIDASQPDRQVRCLIYRRKARTGLNPVILYMHGGGYLQGSAEMGEASHLHLARELDALVISIDYRLSPMTRFPGALEDCYAALRWVYCQGGAWDADLSRVMVSGASAGGGLAAGLALLARDRGEFQIHFQHLIYPMLDDRSGMPGVAPACTGEYVWTPEANVFAWQSLLGDDPASMSPSPYAAPARATDVSGLPPAFIACGAIDLFIVENVAYARKLICAGVPTELHVYAGAPHGFHLIGEADVTRSANRDSFNALARAAGVREHDRRAA
ncbi:alpha/beta hydrolase [Sphingomonas tagetis]|nr:alpha/beta hydrolase [Sphingomonas tagetis]